MASEVLVLRNFFAVTFRRSTIDELEVRRMQQGNPVSGGFHHDGKLSTLSRIPESQAWGSTFSLFCSASLATGYRARDSQVCRLERILFLTSLYDESI